MFQGTDIQYKIPISICRIVLQQNNKKNKTKGKQKLTDQNNLKLLHT